MAKLTYDDVIDAINDERTIKRDDVLLSALTRTVWMSRNGLPGYMPNSQGVNRTKRDAIESCVFIAGDDAPRGFASRLRKYETARDESGESYWVERMTIADLF